MLASYYCASMISLMIGYRLAQEQTLADTVTSFVFYAMAVAWLLAGIVLSVMGIAQS